MPLGPGYKIFWRFAMKKIKACVLDFISYQFVEVEGFEFRLPWGYRGIVYQDPYEPDDDKTWFVSEYMSGMTIARSAGNRRDTIEKAVMGCNGVGISNLTKAIIESIMTFGRANGEYGG
jgi:hypothetical protein